jgi:hypothetical protein
MMGKGAVRVTAYEIDMLETLLEAPSAGAIRNALTESVVLHARQLCEIFLSKGRQPDDIRLEHLVPMSALSDRLLTLVEELKEKYGSSSMEESPCWVFNKMLLHPTTERLDAYNYQPALDV